MCKKALSLLAAIALLFCVTTVFTVPLAGAEGLTAADFITTNAYWGAGGGGGYAYNDDTGMITSAWGCEVVKGDGYAHVRSKSPGSALLGAQSTAQIKLNGASLVIDNVTFNTENGLTQKTVVLSLGNLAAGGNDTNMYCGVNFVFDVLSGKVQLLGATQKDGNNMWCFTGAKFDTLKEESAVVKAMENGQNAFAFAVDADGKLTLTLTNATGSDTFTVAGPNSADPAVWGNHAQAYIGLCAFNSTMLELDVVSVKEGSDTPSEGEDTPADNDSAAIIAADTAAYPVSTDSIVRNSPEGTIEVTDLEGGGAHIKVNTVNWYRLGVNYTGELALDGAHIVLAGADKAPGNICLIMGKDASVGDGDHPARALVSFQPDGTVVNYGDGGQGNIITDSAAVRSLFEGKTTILAFAVADSKVTLTVSNDVGESSGTIAYYGNAWTDHTKAFIGFATQATTGFHEFDILAVHSGDKKCGGEEAPETAPDSSIDIESIIAAEQADHATATDDWATHSEFGPGMGGYVDNSFIGAGVDTGLNGDGSMHIYRGGVGKRALVYTANGHTINGAHIALGNISTGNGHFAIELRCAEEGKRGVTWLIFSDDGNVLQMYEGWGGEAVVPHAAPEIIKAMFAENAKTLIGFKDLGGGALLLTVTNAVGTVDITVAGGLKNAWSENVATVLFGFGDWDSEGNTIALDIYALHGGDKACPNAADRSGEVIDLIEAIGTVTLDKQAAVEAAEAAYKQLSVVEKEKVTNYETLTAARNALDELLAAEVDALIDAIGTVENTEECGAKIAAAEAAYAALTNAQKALVTKQDTLATARDTYDEVSGKNAADAEAAAAVDALIDAIGEVALEGGDAAIVAAEEAYAALTADQKARVTKLDALKAARHTFETLKDAHLHVKHPFDITVGRVDFQAQNTSVSCDEYLEGYGIKIDSWTENPLNWSGRCNYTSTVGFEGLQIKLKGLENMNGIISFALMDDVGDWNLTTTSSKIIWLFYRNGGSGNGYLRAHNVGSDMPHENPLWMANFNDNIWADGEMLIEFKVVDENTATVFVDGQRMGDFGLDDLGLTNLNAAHALFGHWSESVNSYFVYSITSTAQVEAIEAVIEAIDAIGTVDAANAACVERINAAEELYRNLPKQLRDYVANLDTLTEALKLLDGEMPTEPTTEPATENPKTGETASVAPAALLALAAGTVVFFRKRK